MIDGYHKRRGWAAWQTATLQRFDFPGGYPALHQLMGQMPEPAPEQSPINLAHNMRLWKAALSG